MDHKCHKFVEIKGSILRKAGMSAVPCGIVAYFCHYNFHKHFEDWDAAQSGLTIYSGFTFALGFLIVFRMNQAYSRWWEAGNLMLQARGQWFNAFSSLIALSSPAPEQVNEVLAFQHMLARLMSLLYGTSVLQLCTFENPSVETIHIDGLDQMHVKFLEDCHDKVEVVLQWIQKAVVTADRDGTIKAAPPIISRIYSQLGNGMAIVSTARKMGEFPIPLPILQLIRLMLLVQWVATVMISTMIVVDSSWAAILAFMCTLCFWSINYLACELEMPFGDDPDDLPLQHLQSDMNASLTGLLHPLALRGPSFHLPISEGGNVHLKTGVMELQQNGTMDFRTLTKSTETKSDSCASCFKASATSSKFSFGDDKYHSFHVTRVVKGKKGEIRRGPTAEASSRRMQAMRSACIDHSKGFGQDTGATSASAEVRSKVEAIRVDRTPMNCESTPDQTDLAECQCSLECSSSSGQRENEDSAFKYGASAVEIPAGRLKNSYDCRTVSAM